MQSWGYFKDSGLEFTKFDFDEDWYDEPALLDHINNKLFNKVIDFEILRNGNHCQVLVIGEGRIRNG